MLCLIRLFGAQTDTSNPQPVDKLHRSTGKMDELFLSGNRFSLKLPLKLFYILIFLFVSHDNTKIEQLVAFRNG